jgi:hypothetical protein
MAAVQGFLLRDAAPKLQQPPIRISPLPKAMQRFAMDMPDTVIQPAS